jgi:5-methyltetrahydrofolate--homocysteine methyltransferase
MEATLNKISEAMQNGDAGKTQNLTKKAVAMGVSPYIIIKQVLEPTMQQIGVRFRNDEVFIPDVLLSARAMHASLYFLKPLLAKSATSDRGRVMLGTVAGDLHDIGKNMVGMMLQGAGYEVIDIGIDVPVTEFVAAVKKHRPDILGITAALTTTMGKIFEVITALKAQKLRNDMLVFVGGAPVSLAFSQKVGADGYCADGCKVVDLLDSLYHIHKSRKISWQQRNR